MSVNAQSNKQVWPRLASFILKPTVVLAVFWVVALGGTLGSAPWGVPLFWSLMILIALVTAFALSGARPLPALKEQSHLLLRLSWLGRYGTATAVICISTFLGALAGTQLGTTDVQSVVDAATGLVGTVTLFAVNIAAVLFFGWLVIDIWRMGRSHRREGIERSIRTMIGPGLRGTNPSEIVVRWLLALSSLPMVVISVAAIVISFLTAINSIEH